MGFKIVYLQTDGMLLCALFISWAKALLKICQLGVTSLKKNEQAGR